METVGEHGEEVAEPRVRVGPRDTESPESPVLLVARALRPYVRVTKSPRAWIVLALLYDRGPMSPTEIADFLDEKRENVNRALKYLSDYGLVEYDKNNAVWKLTEASRMLMNAARAVLEAKRVLAVMNTGCAAARACWLTCDGCLARYVCPLAYHYRNVNGFCAVEGRVVKG